MTTNPTTTTATIEEEAFRVAEVTDELRDFVNTVEEGDSIGVEYVRNGSVIRVSGTVDNVESEFGDVRFRGESCYLHVNTRTGDYFFSDQYPEAPADGRELREIAFKQ